MRIDNPTSSSPADFGGVAVIGMDANGDGKIAIFFSVDARNSAQVVQLMDPGTGLNISPNTTSTSPLPSGWLANNGTCPMTAINYSEVAVSAATDPNWNGNTDLGADGKVDVFVSFKIPMADIAAVLAIASPVDSSGNYGPRGATGIQGFTKDTTVSYVAFTQTQSGPINADLNGVGANYDKNATFTSLGAMTPPMTASNPVSAQAQPAVWFARLTRRVSRTSWPPLPIELPPVRQAKRALLVVPGSASVCLGAASSKRKAHDQTSQYAQVHRFAP